MDTTTDRPTLLSAARNFIRKSAGQATLVIAPLATLALATAGQAQSAFVSPSASVTNNGSSGLANFSASGFSGSVFSNQGPTNGGITELRFGSTGLFTTNYVNSSGAGDNAGHLLSLFASVSGGTIPAAMVLSLDYDFTLTKQAGIIGDVNWTLRAHLTDDQNTFLASGTLTGPTATFVNTAQITTNAPVPGDYSRSLAFILELTYTTQNEDVLAVTMNSASQGFKVSAAAIPEPSTYVALLGLGAFGFVVLRRVRRNAA